MILQCDQCNTKFRLDDAKLKPGGVKVRCSKCRHVFLAGAEPKHEESEFDAILSGLGAPAQEKPEAAAAAAPDLAGFSFDAEPGAALPTPVEEAGAPAPAAMKPLDYGAAADALATAGPAQGEAPAAPDFAEFASFDFPAEPPAPAQAPVPGSGPVPDYSSFDFAPEPELQKPQEPPAAQALEYDEFAFDEEPAALREEPASQAKDPFDFGEFSFAAEPEPVREQPAPAALDFGEFEFAEEPAAPAPQPPVAVDDLDYGDFSFGTDSGETAAEAVVPESGQAPAASADAFDFGAFSFSEEPAPLQEEPVTAAGQELDFGAFSFSEEPAPPAQAGAPAAEPGSASFSDALQATQAPAASRAAAVADDGFDFDEFTFSQGSAAQPAASATQEIPAAPAPAAAVAAAPAAPAESGAPEPPPAQGHAASAAPLPRDGGAGFEFGFGAPAATRVPEPFELDDETLPPLSIASRRKGRSLLTISIIAVSVLVIVALSGAGLYLLQSGPAAFDKLGIGFVAQWFGMESVEEGRITIRNQQAAFFQNKEAGELFVVSGEAVNSFRKARASILVKVSLFDKKGGVLLQKTAYCGNRLSSDQLATLPMAKIESTMNNQFGDSLSNLGVPPGKAIGFVVAISNVPKEAADFGVEVVSSTVAGK